MSTAMPVDDFGDSAALVRGQALRDSWARADEVEYQDWLDMVPPGLQNRGMWENYRLRKAENERKANEPNYWTPTERLMRSLIDTAQLQETVPPLPLIDGLLYRDSLAVLYGPSGTGKTFLALDFALHVAHGSWWQHRKVDTSFPVLYVVAEGVSGFGPRIEAWQRHHKLYEPASPVHWIPRAVNLYSPEMAGALADLVATICPALVILDTYARCIDGAEENSAKDTGQIVRHLDLIRTAADCCVLAIHHSGKDLTAGSRGSTALKGAVDTELELTGDPRYLLLKNPKQKNAAEADPIRLGLQAVDGTTSVVINNRGDDQEDLPAGAKEVLRALEEIDVAEGVPLTAWEASAEVSRASFYRHRSRLLASQLVSNIGTDKQPRYRPTSRTNTP